MYLISAFEESDESKIDRSSSLGSSYCPDYDHSTSDDCISNRVSERSLSVEKDDGDEAYNMEASEKQLLEKMSTIENCNIYSRIVSKNGSSQHLQAFQESSSTSPSVRFPCECTLGRENHSNKARRIRRKHRCLYCDEDIGNFSRHLERHHTDEVAVQEFMSLDKKCKKRQKLIDKLRREGDFCVGDTVPVMIKRNATETNYIACKFCKGYYSKRSLRKHAKKCYFNPDPSKRFNAQIEGQTAMAGHFGPNDPLRTSGVLDQLVPDNVSMVAKKDKLICQVVRGYLKSHREKHQNVVARRIMRRLAMLLINVQDLIKSKAKLADILVPNNFQTLVSATHKMSGYTPQGRTFRAPSLALQMGTEIKRAINTAFSIEVQKVDCSKDRLEQLKYLITLVENDWAHEVSREASQNLQINKFNKPTLIPLTEDVMVSILRILYKL